MPRSVTVLRLAVVSIALLAGWASPSLAQMPAETLHHDNLGTGPIVESDEAIKVTGLIQCWCGGCSNQTLHDCTCGLAAEERKKVAAALAAGKKPDDLIAAYVADHGAQVRIVPEKTGLDLVGWAIPFAAAVAAILTLGVVLVAWKRRGVELAPAAARTAMSASDRAYRDRLERDLREVE